MAAERFGGRDIGVVTGGGENGRRGPGRGVQSRRPAKTRTRLKDSATPVTVGRARLRLRLALRRTIRERTGSLLSAGRMRSANDERPAPPGGVTRMASAGLIRAALRAGAQAASVATEIPATAPVSNVVGCSDVTCRGSPSASVYWVVNQPPSA